MNAYGFIVQRDRLDNTRFIDDESAGTALHDGDVRLRITDFALTSNNITYAAFGNSMRYWDFYPTAVSGFGRIPVWGFADVIESRSADVGIGERIYGFYPMASHAVLRPSLITRGGFFDGASHRVELHAVYNQYSRCSAMPGYAPQHEAHIALLRPLFVTSFLIDDFLADNAFFGARAVVLSSASSKTAYGTAFCLAQRRGASDAARLVGLTSKANLAFARGLGCYDEVLDYDSVGELEAQIPTVYVDFSGSAGVCSAVHRHFGNRLAFSASIGGTHWHDLGSAEGLPGPRRVLFFAPAQIKKRSADWGSQGLMQRIDAAWAAFLGRVTRTDDPWLTVVRGTGREHMQRTYLELLGGRVSAHEGNIISP
jgi:hypothetical protein